MSARALLEELRERHVSLEAEGLTLLVDAPVGVLTNGERDALAECKPQLLKLLHWERKKLEEADRRGLVIKWAKEPGYIALHDPTTGEWHELKASECSPSIVESAKAYNRRLRRQR